MPKRNQTGSVATFVAIFILALALLATAIFAGWAFSTRQDYKNNSDKKAAAAAEAAKKVQAVELQKQFAEQSKLPSKTFKGSTTYGSVAFNYPKTWSGYVDDTGGNQPLNAYFYPDLVPSLQGKTAFALRVELSDADYSQIVTGYDQQIKDGTVKAAAYVPPKMQGVANVQPGMRFDGAINQDKQGAKVVLKVRDKTLQIYTESKDFVADFNNVVLVNLTFSP